MKDAVDTPLKSMLRKLRRRLFHQGRFRTDKIANGLMDAYEGIFRHLTSQPITLLEIGILEGGSLKYWDSLFRHPRTQIIGIDRNLPPLEASERVTMYACDQNDRAGLLSIAAARGPFDIVIDDAAHLPKETRNCFDTLFPHVRPGGYYAIEDWAVGYWSEERPEYAGMIDVVTEIIQNVRRLGIGSYQIIADVKNVAIFQKDTAPFETRPIPLGVDETSARYRERLSRR